MLEYEGISGVAVKIKSDNDEPEVDKASNCQNESRANDLDMSTSAWMKCKSTVVLSNLGFVLNTSKLPKNRSGSIKVNGITLTTVELLSPIRDNTLGAFGVVTYNKQMIITLNYDEMKLSKADATKLLSNFVGTNQLNHSKLISNP